MRVRRNWAVLAAVAALVALAVAIPVTSSSGASAPGNRSRARMVRDVLRADGIGSARFGASLPAVRATIARLLGQRGIVSKRTQEQCGLDQTVRWWDDHTANGLPELTADFGHSKFKGYQYGDYGTLNAPHPPVEGIELKTSRGLGIGDPLTRGRRLYGKGFALSSAQGGTWSARTAAGPLDGYAWGRPSYGDISWQSVVATIDAGNVGCAALSP